MPIHMLDVKLVAVSSFHSVRCSSLLWGRRRKRLSRPRLSTFTQVVVTKGVTLEAMLLLSSFLLSPDVHLWRAVRKSTRNQRLTQRVPDQRPVAPPFLLHHQMDRICIYSLLYKQNGDTELFILEGQRFVWNISRVKAKRTLDNFTDQ